MKGRDGHRKIDCFGTPCRCLSALACFVYLFACIAVGADAGASDGAEMLLVTPKMKAETYLIGNDGKIFHVWPSVRMPAGAGRSDENGNLLRVERDHLPKTFRSSGAAGGRITKISSEGKDVWSYSMACTNFLVHHDAVQLPNGNVLALVWERHERSEAVSKGRKPEKIAKAGVWSESLWELRPSGSKNGQLVWEWKAWDHVADVHSNIQGSVMPGGGGAWIDVNGGTAINPAWANVTRIEYASPLDQILMVAAGLGAVWIIDHGTTSAEAATNTGGKAGRGGALLYQWAGRNSDDLKNGGKFVVDAEWAPVRDDAEVLIQVLLREHGADGDVRYAVELWRLPWGGARGYGVDSSGGFEKPVVVQSTPLRVPDAANALNRPSALCDKVITYGHAGIARWPGTGEQQGGEFHNTQGETTFTFSTAASSQAMCCGGQAGSEQGAPLSKPSHLSLTSAPVLRVSRMVSVPWMHRILGSTPVTGVKE